MLLFYFYFKYLTPTGLLGLGYLFACNPNSVTLLAPPATLIGPNPNISVQPHEVRNGMGSCLKFDANQNRNEPAASKPFSSYPTWLPAISS